MNWIKRNFFKSTTVLLLITASVLAWLINETSVTENHISLPPYHYSDLEAYGYNYITVSGTFISTAEENIASKLNTVELACDGDTGQCELIQAELFGDNYLSLYTETFQITSWDDNFVTFETLPENQRCVVWKYRIDRFKEELEGRREQSDNYDYDICMGIGLSDFGLKIVDGIDVISEIRGY